MLRIPFEEAVSKLERTLNSRPSQEVPIRGSSGRRVARDVVAGWHLPSLDVSHLDGYAVRASDLSEASEKHPVVLKVAGLSRPDGLGPKEMEAGACIRVLTGGRLPSGADAVVAQEDVTRDGDAVTFRMAVEGGSHVHSAGTDVREGTTLFKKGHLLNARDVAFLFSYGLPSINVEPRLVVGVLATGNELVDGTPGPVEGKVIESNRGVLSEVVGASGFEVLDLGLAKDDPQDIATHLRNGIGRCDVILTTGGSSVSEADLVPEALGLLGATKVFQGLLLRPSRTLGVFLVEGSPVFLLSGLIQGAVSAYCNMVYPTLRFIQGDGWEELPTVDAVLSKGLAGRADDPYRLVTWVRMSTDRGKIVATPAKAPSTTRFVLTKVNGFIVARPGQDFSEGEIVQVRLPYGFGLEDALAGR